ncbi:hypothetical protein SLEP1_g6753 [Rubroshorea leprosula]|uniref:Transposase n=1 Tax=Rubroshorea leprosula TaxID=152421 RepID=A0AAV5HW81_9ROSI|nr:hypothetical protein SLEP1_g6753 [Rubroshorea leprosula]
MGQRRLRKAKRKSQRQREKERKFKWILLLWWRGVSGQVTTWTFVKRLFCEMIINDENPFSVVEKLGEELGDLLESCLRDWGIENVFALTIDNAFVNHGAMKVVKDALNKWGSSVLGKDELHMRFATYIINLVVQDEKVSGSLYTTCNLYFPKICEVHCLLNTWEKIVKLSSMASNMRIKFNKYWDNPLKMKNIFIAVILDPRHKLGFVQFLLGRMYGEELGRVYGEMVKNECIKLFDAYKRMLCAEMDSKSPRFPTVAAIAKDVLDVPISTVASESTFSTASKVLDAFRSSLPPRMIQALICTQDWLRSKLKQLIDLEDGDELGKLEKDMKKLHLVAAIIE